jgi:hypothetical protein
MEIGLAQYLSNKKTIDVPTDAVHLFTVIEQWYWTLGGYTNARGGAPTDAVCIYHHSDGLKYKVEPGQHILGFDINGQNVGRPETFFRGILHIDAIELTPQLTRLWVIPKGYDDLADGLIAYIREAYGLGTQPVQPSPAKPTSKKRKGGPIPTPDADIDAVLKEWDEVKGKESQESFCNRKGIGVSTLGAWQRKRKR